MKIYRLFALGLLLLISLPTWAQTAFTEYNGEKFALIDGKTLKPLTPYKYESIGKFQDGLALSTLRSEAGKLQYSFLNEQGKEIILPTPNRMFEFSEGKARFKQGEKYGFLDKQGKAIIPANYSFARDFKEGRAFVKNAESAFMFIDEQGNPVIRFTEDLNFVQDFQEGLALVGLRDNPDASDDDPLTQIVGKFSYYNKQGKKVIDLQQIDEKINSTTAFQHGVAVVGFINPNFDQENPTRYGVINTKGELILPLKYNFIEIEKEGFIKVQQHDPNTYQTTYGIYDTKGKEIMPCVYSFIFNPIGSYRVFQKKKEGIVDYAQYPDRYGIADLQGKTIVEPEMKDVYLNKNGEYLELDTLVPDGQTKTPEEFQPTVSMYAYKNIAGKVLVSSQPLEMYSHYMSDEDSNFEYRPNSLMPFSYVSKIGVVNLEKHELTLPLYDDIAPFLQFPKDGYVAIKEGKHWSYLNEKLEKVQGTKYEYATNFEDNFYAPVKKDGKWGIINKAGMALAPFAFDSIIPNITRLKFDKTFSMMAGQVTYEELHIQILPTGNFIAQKNKQWGIINWNGQTLLPFQYEQIQDAFYNYIVISKAGKFGVVDYAGKELIPASYSQVKVINDLVYVRENGKEGLLDLQNNVIIKTIYDTIFEPSQNYIKVIKNKKIGYLAHDGKEVLPTEYDAVNFWSDRDPFIVVTKNGKQGVLNNKFQTIVPCEYDSLLAELWRKYIWVKKGNLQGLLESDGRVAFPIKYQYIDNLEKDNFTGNPRFIIAQLNNKWGILDTAGRAVVPFEYDYMKPDYDKKRFIIGKKGKFGVLKEGNKIIIPLKYDEVGQIHYDLEMIGIKKKGKWGFANTAGKEIVPPTYDDAFAAQKIQNESNNYIHYAIVKKGKYWGIINVSTGKVAVPFRYDQIDYIPYSTKEPISVWRNGAQEQVNFRGEPYKAE